MNYEEAKKMGIAPWTELKIETKNFYVFRDKFPVSPGHMLFVPKDDSDEKVLKCYRAAYRWGKRMYRMGNCDGFNVGQNFDKAAGQTVMYPHIHMIPRYKGDMEEPAGGVRHVIPNKAKYEPIAHHQV